MALPPDRVRSAVVLLCLALAGCGDASGVSGPSPDRALVLDGEAWVEFDDRGDLFDLVPGGERTISLWLRYDRPQYHAKILFKTLPTGSAGTVAEDRGYMLFVHQYSSSVGIWHRGGVSLDESGYTQGGTAGTRKVGDGGWHHVAVVQRDTLIEAWVDGRLEFVENLSRTLPQLANDASVILGWGDRDAVRFAGQMDELTLWDRALSPRELRRLRYASPDVGAAGLVAYWPMDESGGDRVADRTAGAWHGRGTRLSWAPATRPLAPPFRERPTFVVLVAAVALGLFYASLRLYGLRLERQKRSLERQVEERVADLARTNAEKDDALALVASQARRLEELNEAKSRFFTNISHEFRTPLSLIVGPLSDVLDRQHGSAPFDGEARAAVQVALRSGRRLGHLTGQLLDLARLESQALHLEEQPLDLCDLLRGVTGSLRLAAERKEVRLRESIPEGPLWVMGDAHRLETVFINLVSNAIRFTPGGKEISVEVEATDGRVGVVVRDQGAGVEPEARERIFERFFQSTLGIQSGEGMGVGLALARELVELHGGHLVLLEDGRPGAAFQVALPLSTTAPVSDAPAGRGFAATQFFVDTGPELVDRPTVRVDAGPEEGDHAFAPLVLVVEDHAELRAFLCEHLSRRFRVAEAGDGQTALDLARETPPDVVVSDVMMPGMDGLELLERIRADQDLASLGVILLTARGEVRDRVEGLGLGADDYLSKPFEPTELTARILSLIEGRRRLAHALRASVGVRASGAPADGREGDGPEARRPELRARLEGLVESRLDDPELTVDELAAAVAMERTGLYKVMTAEWGVAPSDFVRDIRLRKAADLLAGGNTVAEVAYAVGYGSVSSFSRRFQEQYGVRPGRWAREGPPASA